METAIIEHKCFACGYEYKEEMSYSSDAYACPKCKTMKLA